MKEEHWDIVIQSKSRWFALHLKDVWNYRDLIYMFIKRDFIALYKQTILGPLWFIIQPLITTATYILVFGEIANLKTDGQPKVLFYLSGIIFWNYFSSSLIKISDTFSANAGVFGKIYFPRLTVPVATICTSFVSFCIQFLLFTVIYIGCIIWDDYHPQINAALLLIPVLIVIASAFSLGLGIIISALTTKYRDLKFVIAFGIQLLMYAAPVVYPLSEVSDEKLAFLLKLNPLTSIIESFRYAVLGSGTCSTAGLSYSAFITFFLLITGIALFNKIEKNFMDTI